MPVGPLQNIRVTDLTRVWSGPHITRIMADFGADIIKVEYRDGRGPTRVSAAFARDGIYPNNDGGDQAYNRQGSFNKHNRNKRSVVLDLTTPKGKEIFKRLVAISDVVIENFSARVMGHLGLSYSELCKVKEDIIMLSMPGYGTTGPYRDYISFGPSVEPMTGLQAAMGYSDDEPRPTSSAHLDGVAGNDGATAVMIALWRRKETGKGTFIDLSQQESGIATLGEYALGYQLEGHEPHRIGNRHASYAPHGVYRCAGEDNWVSIGVRSDAEFERFSRVLEHPEWLTDSRFADQASRWQNQDILSKEIEAWTTQRDKYAVMHQLQAERIPAGAVLNCPEILSDPHLAEREFFVSLDHAAAGRFPYPGLPIRAAGIDPSTWYGPPLLGEHNREVLEQLLGYTPGEVNEFQEAGIIADRPTI